MEAPMDLLLVADMIFIWQMRVIPTTAVMLMLVTAMHVLKTIIC